MIDFATLERPASPNSYLVCTPELCRAAASDRTAPVFKASLAEVQAALRALRPELAFATTPQGSQTQFVAVTRVLRFKDDVDILLAPEGEGAWRVAVYSRSRVGYSDLGANQRRVEALLAGLAARLTPRDATPTD